MARGGIIPSIAYGAESIGIRTSEMRGMRKSMASASRIRSGGSSATARRAPGGCRYAESDPLVLLGNPPLVAVASALWDDPRCRGGHVEAWRSARARLAPVAVSKRWAVVRGPVDAAMVHVWEVRGDWRRPFEIEVLDKAVNLLRVPPKQVMRLIQLHNRWWLDLQLLDRLGDRINWDTQMVKHTYRHGVDWQLLRDMLNGRRGDLGE